MKKKFMKTMAIAGLMSITVAASASASIFGPVNGSGWSIFGPVHGSGWGVSGSVQGGGFGAAQGQGWSIFGPVTGSGWSIFGPVNGSGWGMHPHMMQQPQQPALVAIHCTFGEDTLMLAKSVDDCESAGGAVHADVKAATQAN
ncbi:MAG: hypothetical protein V3U96_12630 [Paracoccaceae bacterium]